MKKQPLLIICLGLALSGCTTNTTSYFSSSNSSSRPISSRSSISESIEIFSDNPTSEKIDDSIPFATVLNNGMEEKTLTDVLTSFKKEDYGYYGGTFDKKIDEPSSVVNSHQELTDLLDYCAFYRIKEKEITLNFGTNSIEECNLAAWDSLLIPGTVGTKFTQNESGTIKAEFKYTDNANSFIPRDVFMGVEMNYFPYIYDYKDEGKAKIDAVPYVGDKELDVHNSDQLIYALSHGYKPVMQNDSPAKKIYDKATSILKDIIYKNMNDNEKLLAIEFYLNNNTVYDSVSDDNAAYISATHSENVEEVACLFRGFYAEGALFNNGAVCYGFAKAQALMSLLLGFQVKLTHGKLDLPSNESNDAIQIVEEGLNIYSAHGISLVRKDNNSKWGICDPTFRSAGSLTASDTRVEFMRYPAIMLNVQDWRDIYGTADEVALRYLTSDEIVEKSYDITTDYRLVGGGSLTPRSDAEIKKTFDGIVATVEKASYLLKSTYARFYSVTLYTKVESDEEALTLSRTYDGALTSHKLFNWDITYYRWQTKDYFNIYGYNIIIRY